MTERLRLPRSLDAKMLYMVLLSLACAVAVYLAAYGAATLALERLYLSPNAVASRQAEYYTDFAAYVRGNQITGGDSAAVSRWNSTRDYVTISVFTAEELGIDPRPSAQGAIARPQYSSLYGKLYPLQFADGQRYIRIDDKTDVREDNLNRIIALLLGSLAFVAVMFSYIRVLTTRIIRLAREADAIGAGDLEHAITTTGEDELSQLASEIDHMRHAVIERMSGERRAWEANSELITAVSHDIRTPMTSLLGYLELLNENVSDEEKSRQFASSAYGKALELKDLTDELFKYFLVFGRAELQMDKERYDARLLLEQLLGEAEFDLTDAGFRVQRIEFEGECGVTADPLYLKRVLDNLVSNAKKYADRSEPVLILSERKNGELTVCVSNAVAETAPQVESTKIGLRTCEKIMQAMDGRFETRRDDRHFAASFILPENTDE